MRLVLKKDLKTDATVLFASFFAVGWNLIAMLSVLDCTRQCKRHHHRLIALCSLAELPRLQTASSISSPSLPQTRQKAASTGRSPAFCILIVGSCAFMSAHLTPTRSQPLQLHHHSRLSYSAGSESPKRHQLSKSSRLNSNPAAKGTTNSSSPCYSSTSQ
jgi:hypothetical protein